jgi:lipopolysaccharide/colanic/teichoic acid biosynthesis glycosyltransferase
MNILLKVLFFLGLILVSPLITFAMVLIFIEDRFPVIFIQERLGKNKKIIKVYKIRTMKKHTPNLGTHEVNNNNYLKIGSFLRKVKIDELPQVVNFLKGEIDIIGPRPCLPNQLDLIKLRDDSGIFNIKPGITGLAQVLGYDMSDPEILTKIEKLYINKKSIKLDLLIFVSTFIRGIRRSIQKSLKSEINNIINI